jgi:hypothetical protein
VVLPLEPPKIVDPDELPSKTRAKSEQKLSKK